MKFGTDFLQRMWDDRTRTLYYQVGIGAGDTAGTIASDHDIWRLAQADDTYQGTDPTYKYIRHRPVFQAGPPGSLISPNLAGRLAADMALCFQLYKRTAPAYANKCLRSGEHIFNLADTSPGCPADGHPDRVLSGDGMARRPRTGRDGARHRHRGR